MQRKSQPSKTRAADRASRDEADQPKTIWRIVGGAPTASVRLAPLSSRAISERGRNLPEERHAVKEYIPHLTA